MRPTLKVLLESLQRHGYSYEVLGLGKPWKGFKARIGTYANGIKPYASGTNPEALSIFIDAYDVICMKDAEKVYESYMGKKRKGDILFATELYCLSNSNAKTLDWFTRRMGSKKRKEIDRKVHVIDNDPDRKVSEDPVFLNFGFVMGPARALLELFEFMDKSGIEDDQLAACDYFIKHMDDVDLDLEENMVRTKLSIDKYVKHSPHTLDKLPDENGEGPAFLHYPAMRSKEQQAELLKRFANYTSKSSSLFTDAYVITMDEYPERYKRIKPQADAAGFHLKKWKGVKITPNEVGSLPPQGVGTTHYKDRTGKTFNLGVIGAFLAHRSLLRNIAANPRGVGTLIFEDDVEIPPDFFDRLNAHISEVPDDWDILFLSKFREHGTMVSKHLMKLPKDMSAERNWGLWSFIVKNSSLREKILPTMEYMLDVPDIQLNTFADKINMYLLVPSIVQPDHTSAKSIVSELDLQKA
jgi:GR25 family glycosyltransferase involved in LPS biosynthesis